MRAALLLSLPAALAFAQPAPAPVFEVVSVKHSGNTNLGVVQAGARIAVPTRPFRFNAGKVTCNQPLSAIIEEAYGVKAWQIQGPGWLTSELYELAAIMPEGTSRDTARLMLRSMLVDRFGLVFRREQKESPAYSMVLIEGTRKPEPVIPKPGTGIGYTTLADGFDAEPGMPLGELADMLSRRAGRPVIDQTGLAGLYKVRLRWNPDGGATGILSAISQIGLKLEPRKKMFDVLIIEKVLQTPTEN